MIVKSCPSTARVADGQTHAARHNSAGRMPGLIGRVAVDSKVAATLTTGACGSTGASRHRGQPVEPLDVCAPPRGLPFRSSLMWTAPDVASAICSARARPLAPPMGAVSRVRSPLAARPPGVLRHDRATPARHRALRPSHCLRGERAGCPATPEKPVQQIRQRPPTGAVDCADRLQAGGLGQPPAASSAQPRQSPCAAGWWPWHTSLISRDVSRVQWIGMHHQLGHDPAEFDGDLPCHRRHPSRLSGDRVPARCTAGSVDGRPLWRSTGAWRRAADAPGASVARREICHRGW